MVLKIADNYGDISVRAMEFKQIKLEANVKIIFNLTKKRKKEKNYQSFFKYKNLKV